jgi:type 1 glutamine amidotransferase
MISTFRFLAVSAVLLTLSSQLRAQVDPYDQSKVPIEFDTKDTSQTKIVLLAGGPSSKTGQHEYFAGCALLMDWLKQTPGVFPVLARDGWPKNEAIFKNAKAVVFFGDGGGKQPFLASAKWKILEQTLAAGAGLVLLHQGVDFPIGSEKEIKNWSGGVFLSDIGCRGHWDMEFTEIGSHPVLRGLKPFKLINDGWLYNMHFAGEGVTPVLAGAVPDKSRTTQDAKNHTGRNEVVAWAYEKAGQGRSFSFTGCDLHSNWSVESQRKLVVNGILWSAGLQIPRLGAPVAFKPEDLQRNLDDKRTPPKPASPAK